MERRESEERPAENDLALWKEACGELRGLMKVSIFTLVIFTWFYWLF